MKVYIVGIGMDGVKTITKEAMAIIESADVLIGAERMLEPFSYLDKQCICSWKPDEIKNFLKQNNLENVVILMSGDCGFYSGAQKLISVLEDFETEVICGISSPVYFCSKINKPWQNMKFISLHGAKSNIVRNVCCNEHCFFLLGGDMNVSDICKKLCEYGMNDVLVYIGENLAYENERILTGIAKDFITHKSEKLAVMITENHFPEKSIFSGIPDDMFVRESVPMTKSEIRCIAVSKLNIGRNDICWDVGCGTGSVTVEMGLRCVDGKVFAVDKNDEAVRLTNENVHKFCCDNIEVINGNAPECLEFFPAPDKVFIGGSCGKIEEILHVVFSKNPCAEIVITAVSIETLASAVETMKKNGIKKPEIVQIAVTRTRKVGTHTMFSGENPVFIIKGAKS